ncbi:M48 family metallopeptidase [Chloroflexales bacterium ZM16-3]|nr:M48 family metallopeptidase [Chloroflexales bacterium ZM16-3]
MHQISVSGITVDVVRKDIKNLHLGVYPPHGRVRVAAPLRIDDDAVRLFTITRLGWIKRQQAQFEAQERQSPREYVTGESHYYQGHRYLLNVEHQDGPPKVILRNNTWMDLIVRPDSDAEQRERVLLTWYRQQLRALAAPLIASWAPVLGVSVAEWGIKRMKTKWGTCNIEARRIWLNLELVKKSPQCLEYLVVHEMVHLLERHHNERFSAHMSRFLPQWQRHREELNRAPLGHEEWGY